MVNSLYLARYHTKRITILYIIWISIICMEAMTYCAFLIAAYLFDPMRIFLLDTVEFKDFDYQKIVLAKSGIYSSEPAFSTTSAWCLLMIINQIALRSQNGLRT